MLMMDFNKTEEAAAAGSSKYPPLIERRLKGYNAATVVFVGFGMFSWFFTRSFLSIGLGVLLACMIGILNILQRMKLRRDGFDCWHFKVIDHAYLTPINRKPTGIYAEALDGPYVGRICHIALASQMVTPPIDHTVEVFVPGDLVASPIRDILYIPQHYGVNIVK